MVLAESDDLHGSTAACDDAGGAASFNGSARTNSTDYVLPSDIVSGWGASVGALDPGRDLIGDFTGAGWTYAPDASGARGGAAEPAVTRSVFAVQHERRARQDRQTPRDLDCSGRLRIPRSADAR